MTTTTVSTEIQASAEDVFKTVSEIENFSKAVPHIVNVEFLSDIKSGVGTRFRETRLMKGKEASTELEVTEYQPHDRVRIVSDTHGTVWDTVFTVKPAEEGRVTLTMTMEARAYKLLARLMNPLIKGMIKKAIQDDMAAVKAYCEA